jgi:AcrR family transcriptional regulator
MQTGRKSTQRERLLNGVITVANRDGSSRASVSAVIAEAGVSRPTFYDYFADRGDCVLGALTDIHERLLDEVREAVQSHAPARALQSAITALVRFATVQPAQARFLMGESMAAGPTALDARDQGIAEIERIIEAAGVDLALGSTAADVCPHIVIGGVYRLLAARLRRGEPRLSRSCRTSSIGSSDMSDQPGSTAGAR